MTDTIADKLFSANGQTSTTDQLPEGETYQGKLVGEGKQFADFESLAKGKYMADTHIKNLEGEMKALREELGKRVAAEEFASRLMEQIKTSNGNPNPGSNSNPQGGVETNREQPGVNTTSTTDINQLVKQLYDQQIALSKAEQNVDYAITELKKVYGDSYTTKVNETANNLGISKESVARMAEESPKAFLKLVMDNTKVDTSFVPPQGTVNTSGSGPKAPRTFKDYEKLRKENPVLYFDQKTQLKMHEDAKQFGDAFYR